MFHFKSKLLTLVLFYSISLADYISLMNKEGTNQWWHAIYVDNENENAGEIRNVNLFFGNLSISDAISAYSEEGEFGTFYAFQYDDGMTLPYSIELTYCAGDTTYTLTLYDIITNRQNFSTFDTSIESSFDSNSDNNETNFTQTCEIGYNTNNIVLINKDGINSWWYALYITNINSNAGQTISSIEFKDSSVNNTWVTGYSEESDDEYEIFYAFQAEDREWELPYSIRITNCAGDVITSNDVITNMVTSNRFDFQSNFGDSTCAPTTAMPTAIPSAIPSASPSKTPSDIPSAKPSMSPSKMPTNVPTMATQIPTQTPSKAPTNTPSNSSTNSHDDTNNDSNNDSNNSNNSNDSNDSNGSDANEENNNSGIRVNGTTLVIGTLIIVILIFIACIIQRKRNTDEFKLKQQKHAEAHIEFEITDSTNKQDTYQPMQTA